MSTHSHSKSLKYFNQLLTQVDCEVEAKRKFKQADYFEAYDYAQSALEHFPDSLKLKQISANSLIRVGALDEAQEIIEPLCTTIQLDRPKLYKIYKEYRSFINILKSTGFPEEPPESALHSLGRLLGNMQSLQVSKNESLEDLQESYGLLARVHKGKWLRTDNHHEGILARDIYENAFKTLGGYWLGINAATLTFLLDQKKGRIKAESLATEVLESIELLSEQEKKSSAYFINATIGEAKLILGKVQESIEAYTLAMQYLGDDLQHKISSHEQLCLLENNGFKIPDELKSIFKPPMVVVFTGHMIDRPGREVPRFPDYLEDYVTEAIKTQINLLDAKVGFSSACNGSDIIFAEEMLNINAEVNIILPFAMDDFIEQSIKRGDISKDSKWITRFKRVIKEAKSVHYVTEEKFLGDNNLFDFANQMFYGYSLIKAKTLNTQPHLLAVFDQASELLQGGARAFLERWPSNLDKTIIPLEDIRQEFLKNNDLISPIRHENKISDKIENTSRSNRQIKAMLFADIEGYSKMGEEETQIFLKNFFDMMNSSITERPEYANTWGDAIFAVHDNARFMAEYAFKIQKIICRNWRDQGINQNISIRIALHMGPVYNIENHIKQGEDFFGSHVNRTARIEPITVSGNIFASEQFVAKLLMEHEDCRRSNNPMDEDIVCDWIGSRALAKDFASQALFHIRRKGT